MYRLNQGKIPFVQRNRKRWSCFNSDFQPSPKSKGHGKASFTLDQAGNEPWIKAFFSFLHRFLLPSLPRRGEWSAYCAIIVEIRLSRLSFRISRYGVTKTSLGVALRAAHAGGFLRYELTCTHVLADMRGNSLTRQGISLDCLDPPYLVGRTAPCRHPCMSPCRWDYLFSSRKAVRRIVSEDSDCDESVFPADCPHRMDYHCHFIWRVPADSRSFQHTAEFY